MHELTSQEVMAVAGAGWAVFILPVVIGFVTGGPVGALMGAGGVIATTGVKNLEHMHRNHGSIPSFNDMAGGK